MSIEDYVDPMDRCDQGLIIDLVGDKEVSKGICRMLSINWLVECTKANASQPNVVWHEMKANGPVYFKQIANQQKAYAEFFNAKLEGWIGSVWDCISLASYKRLKSVVTSVPDQIARRPDEMTESLCRAMNSSTTNPLSCIISFSCPVGNHCIAAIEHPSVMGSTWYIFDPNYGVLIIDISKGQSLGDAVSDLFDAYAIEVSKVAPIAQ
jgi:hypothetical protein